MGAAGIFHNFIPVEKCIVIDRFTKRRRDMKNNIRVERAIKILPRPTLPA